MPKGPQGQKRPADVIDPTSIPRDQIDAARVAIERAIAGGDEGAPIAQRLGMRLRAAAERRRALLSLDYLRWGPMVTIAIAPRDRDGAKLWPMMADAAVRQDQSIAFARPREPSAIVLAYPAAMAQLATADDLAWLPMLEAEFASTWLEMIHD